MREKNVRTDAKSTQIKTLAMLSVGLVYGLTLLFFLIEKHTPSRSLASVIAWSDTLSARWHLIFIGVLPIILSVLVFGAGMLLYTIARYLYLGHED